MQQHYKLIKIRELAENDEEFIKILAQTFIEEVSEDIEKLKSAVSSKSFQEVYKVAYKMKPTIDLFELNALENVIKVQDWGDNKLNGIDITNELDVVITVVNNALVEIKSDFNL